ncbi:MAG: hypothetical protein D8M59_14295 [Planctomycetes bacterium]|nr:hypothetical protein [Planctomycetota bacterium]NOG55502.1 hypothetical protein [Planctomycetota bacterium]
MPALPACFRFASNRLLPRVSAVLILLLVSSASTIALAAPPDFKPFVMLDLCDIGDPGGEQLLRGETLDVNNAGIAVGWIDVAPDERRAFLFDPAIGYIQWLPGPPPYTRMEAHGINEDTEELLITGTASESSGSPHHAVYWRRKAGEWKCVVLFGGSDESVATDVSDRRSILGAATLNGVYTSFQLDDFANELLTPHPQRRGTAADLDSGLNLVGTYVGANAQYHAYYWRAKKGSLYDIEPSSQQHTGATAINDWGHIVGWTRPDGGSNSPTFWERRPGNSPAWTPHTISVNYGPETNTQAVDLNEYNEVLIVNDDPDASGAYLWKWDELLGQSAYDLNEMALKVDFDPNGTAAVHKAWAINDAGWIAGSYKPDGPGLENEYFPILMVPYNINNNYYPGFQDQQLSIPDYREILEDPALDVSGRRWMLDWGETFRSGLYAMGATADDGPAKDCHGYEILNVQIVRMHIDQVTLQEMLEGEQPQSTFNSRINEFGVDKWPGGTQREILLLLRTVMPCEAYDDLPGWTYSPDYDYLPPIDGPRVDCTPGFPEWTRDEMLEGVRCLSYQMAHNIDYVQFGNEVYRGLGMYYFGPDDISCEGWSGGPLSQLLDNYPDCVAEASSIMMESLVAQMRAVRIGSTLAGRPLRIIGPAPTRKMLFYAMLSDGPEDTHEAYGLWAMYQYTNKHADMCSVHLHHEDLVTEAHVKAIVEWLDDEENCWLAFPENDAFPKALACTEWGPFPSYAWRDLYYSDVPPRTHRNAMDMYYLPPMPNDYPPDATWDDFIYNQWMTHEIGPGPDLGVHNILSALSEAGYVFALYGGYSQSYKPFDMSSLWSNLIHPFWLQGDDRFNEPVRDAYERNAAPYVNWDLDDFHPRLMETITPCNGR